MQRQSRLQLKKRIKKIRRVRKSDGPQRDKILRRLKKGTRINMPRIQSLGIRIFFDSVLHIINFYGATPFDTLILFTFVLFLLEKLLLLSILLICRILYSLMSEDINGN